jgi:hypothetical protein
MTIKNLIHLVYFRNLRRKGVEKSWDAGRIGPAGLSKIRTATAAITTYGGNDFPD